MRQKLSILLAALFLAIPATAQTVYDWSHVGSTGVVGDTGAFSYTHAGPTMRFRSISTGTIVARYNVTNTYGSGSSLTPPWTTLTAAFTDDSSLGSVTVKLIELDKCSNTETTICTINSSDSGSLQCETCSFSSSTFDFANNSYYVEVTLARTSTTANEQIHTVAVDD